MTITPIKRSSTLFLQAVIVFIGITIFAWMLWFPQVEGRNAHSDPISLYFNDPFLAYVYISSIAFFAALYQAFMLLGSIRRNTAFSPHSLKSLRIIKYCAATLVALIAFPVSYLFVVRPEDDIAGGVAMGLFAISVSLISATAASVFEGIVQSATERKPKAIE